MILGDKMGEIIKIWVDSLVQPFKNMFTVLSNPTFWGGVLTLFLPMILFYGMCYLFLFVYTFVMWKLPHNFPIPFYNPMLGLVGDRVMLVVGGYLIIHSELGHD